MSDGVVIPLDVDDTRARGKLARLKGDAAQTGKAFGNAATQAARVGGAGGGMVGRGIGGFNQGMGAGFVGLGLAAAGAGLNAFLARDAERVQRAGERVQREQARAAISVDVMEQRNKVAAGGLSYAQKVGRATSRGATLGDLKKRTDLATLYGLTTEQGVDMFEAEKDNPGVTPTDIATAMRTRLFNSASEAAGAIAKAGSLTMAVALAGKMRPDEANALFIEQDRDKTIRNTGRATAAGNTVAEQQLNDLTSGRTADVLENQARNELNPAGKLLAQAAAEQMKQVDLLRAQAEAQSTIAGLLAEAGRVVGLSEGSAARKLQVAASAATE